MKELFDMTTENYLPEEAGINFYEVSVATQRGKRPVNAGNAQNWDGVKTIAKEFLEQKNEYLCVLVTAHCKDGNVYPAFYFQK